jgi:hypothetical protein
MPLEICSPKFKTKQKGFFYLEINDEKIADCLLHAQKQTLAEKQRKG